LKQTEEEQIMTKSMQRSLLGAAVIGGILGIGAALSPVGAGSSAGIASAKMLNAFYANNGPYRDGLYVGRLHAEAGRAPKTTTSRWSTGPDRAAFMEGYRQGYQLAAKAAHKSNPRASIPA
jgi:hypothetical protein